MAELTAAQSTALVERRSQQDLNDLILVFQRDGSVSGDFADPFAALEGDEKTEAEEARDEAIANSQLLIEPPVAGPSEEELSGNLEAAQLAGEVEEEAPAPKTGKKAAAAEEA